MGNWQEEHNKASQGLKFLRSEGRDSVYEVKRTVLAKGSFIVERLVTIEAYYERLVWSSSWEEKGRYSCFCCSCPSGAYRDPCCRNHGFDGERPCELHNLEGSVDEQGIMPISVQAERIRQEGVK